jgi:thiol-disulfide isomerase/thioredoxin
MLSLGVDAPPFELVEPKTGQLVSIEQFSGRALAVMFICNHCPYVLHIIEKLVDVAEVFGQEGVQFIAINSNDVLNYPEDSPEKMVTLSEQYHFSFPYLYDESQQVAKAYRAACTPDLFLFDSDHQLVYRGQFDDARPHSDAPVTGRDFTDAIKALIAGFVVPEDQKPSLGCNIKWKAGNEPDYFG